MEVISRTATFGGEIQRVQHRSTACDCEMTFGIFLPPQAKERRVPVLYWLSGLTCTGPAPNG
jgi:S-formylglutathione hydrolase